MKIVDDELQARFEAINKNKTRSAKYLDLHTFQAVDQPSRDDDQLAGSSFRMV